MRALAASTEYQAMTYKTGKVAAALVAIAACVDAQAQTAPYRTGETVELHANGEHWQRCVVVEPGSKEAVMRLDCEDYAAPGYSRAGGIYVASYNSDDVRKPDATAATPAALSPAPQASRSVPGSAPMASRYRIGQAVEVEASNHWVPCVVDSIDQVGSDPLIRVNCTAYPALSRVAGIYIVHNAKTGLRPATGQIGPQPAPVANRPKPPAAAKAGALPLGEYACVGSGGRIMIGLGFRLTGSRTYTDLDGASRGTYTITGSNIRFNGGHLDGVAGREINGKGFRIAAQAECELW